MEAIMHQLVSGQLTVLTVLIWTVIIFLLSMAGGAIAAVKLAGKDLGNELAASMGAMFGPTGAVPGILLGLIILAFI